ncbi:hypothetical protein TL16_g00575 [Triparma laevis f. inornata]|uniref:Uncharacterized protein n=1 Tax=Triparma laevis f. inornata TaxID=1714386 RepID=A0A9W7DNM0_9STRA|nr:hypothetical protein TL16_g00575 [Triparma laevis f. inornata]
MSGMSPEEEAAMLAELKAISTKASDSRFDGFAQKVVKTVAVTDENTTTNGLNTVDFLQGNPEDPALNQYWYSQASVDALTLECERLIKSRGQNYKVAFLSTPSIYFALSDESRGQCWVMDYDKKWESDRGFVFYDFNKPADFGSKTEELIKSFDLVVIDPPFITREVWEKYTESAHALLKENPTFNAESGQVIGTTVAENAPFMEELLGCKAQKFRPSIPNLVYQYNSYANFDGAEFLGKSNPEIDP